MALTVTHNFVSPVSDLDEPGIVGPDEWNEGHSLAGTLPVVNGGTGAPTAAGARANLGISATRSVRVVTASGAVTVDADTDDIIVIKKTVAASTAVNLPSAANRDDSRPIKIVDGKLDAATNNITITPNGVETIVGLSTYVINFDAGSVELWPLPDGTAWYI